MTDKVELARRDAEEYLELAEHARSGDFGNRIVVALCIHSLIRGNDALTLKYLGSTAKGRGHDSHIAFEKLYTGKEEFIEPRNKKYKSTLKKWIKSEKSRAEYKTKTYSKRDSDRCLKQTRRFLEKCVKENI
ncbi:MAG: hypothetical protein ACLFS3_03010 [Candidatus Aenigmatarchaeota archaeon]